MLFPPYESHVSLKTFFLDSSTLFLLKVYPFFDIKSTCLSTASVINL